jgi:hypothetical protein
MPWPPPPPARHGAPLPDLPRLQSTPQLASPRRTEAPRPLPRRSRLPERHHRYPPPSPGAELRGRPASDHPSSTRTPPEVLLYFLMLLNPWPLDAGDRHRRKHGRRRLLYSQNPAKGQIASPQFFLGSPVQVSRGLSAKFFFLFILKNSKIVNSFINHRKIRKIQTKICWITYSKIYNFSYRFLFNF